MCIIERLLYDAQSAEFSHLSLKIQYLLKSRNKKFRTMNMESPDEKMKI